MHVDNILAQGAVKPLGSATSKKRLFLALGELAFQAYDLNADEVTAALSERESLGGTGVGKGVALPHARLESLDKVKGLFIRLEQPLEFGSIDRQPVDLVFTLLAPAGAGVEHLKSLALVSRTLRDTELCQKLRANVDPATLHALLTEEAATKAA